MALLFKNSNDPEGLVNKQAITLWLRQYALATEQSHIIITELPCLHQHDNCADYTTIISITTNSTEQLYTLHKPLLYIRKHDIYNLINH